jgi:hypothetical protein
MAAGRLREALTAHFGADAVFRDKESIRAGHDWKEEIDRAIGDDTIVLALIGPTWLEVRNAAGRRRLEDPEDTNRGELEHSLKRRIPIVPVLVEDTEMPSVENLPEALQGLVRRNALRLRDDDWRSDIGRIIESLESLGVQRPSHIADDVKHPADNKLSSPRSNYRMPGAAESGPSDVKVSGKAILSLILVVAGSLALGEGPGFPFPESLSRQNAVVMTLLSFVALALAISAWADINKNKAKGKMLALIAIAVSSIGLLGLGIPLLLGQ